MRDHPHLTRDRIAKMTLSQSVSTVDRWLVPPTTAGLRNPTYRKMPSVKLYVLRVALGSISVVEQKSK